MKKSILLGIILLISISLSAQYTPLRDRNVSLKVNALLPLQKAYEMQVEAMLSNSLSMGFALAHSYGNQFDYDYMLRGFFRAYSWDPGQRVGVFAEIASTVPMYDRNHTQFKSEPLFGVGGGVKIISAGGFTTEINAGYVFADIVEFIWMSVISLFHDEYDPYYHDHIPDNFFKDNKAHAYYGINIGISI